MRYAHLLHKARPDTPCGSDCTLLQVPSLDVRAGSGHDGPARRGTGIFSCPERTSHMGCRTSRPHIMCRIFSFLLPTYNRLLFGMMQLVTEYVAHASVLPPTLDFSPCSPAGGPLPTSGGERGGDGYSWPHCSQPLYHGALPQLLNLTVCIGLATLFTFKLP